jgi:hypothetical protein
MNLQETIKRILREQSEGLGEKTKLEKTVTNFINKALEDNDLPKNFHGAVADIYKSQYGQGCNITFLFNNAFSMDDSSKLIEIGNEIRNLVKMFFHGEFPYGVNISTSTVEHYLKYKKRLKELNSNKEEFTEGELTEKCWPGYTQKGMKTMFGKRYPNCVKKTKKG